MLAVGKRCIDAHQWPRLTEILQQTPTLKVFCNGDDSLLSYARTLGEAELRAVINAGVSVNIQYTTGDTLLMDFTSCGNLEMVRFLLLAGSDANLKSFKGETAFSYACARNQLACAKELYAHGANVKLAIGPAKLTAVEIVDQFGSQEFLSWLLEVQGNQVD